MQKSSAHVLVVTNEGISGFDGHTWTSDILPADLNPEACRLSSDGTFWFITYSNEWARWARPGAAEPIERLRTVRYRPEDQFPETEMTVFLEEVSHPGNTVFFWRGIDPWRGTLDEELQYAWRLDGEEWSMFGQETSPFKVVRITHQRRPKSFAVET